MTSLPTLFISHGAPTFAIDPGVVGPRLTALGRSLPRPDAVLIVSPHWMTPTPQVSVAAQPETIHDFSGFDPELYSLRYPAPGHPALAQRAVDYLRDAVGAAVADPHRGLDHGAWVPLRYLFPEADVPAFQVSLPTHLNADKAWAYGQALAPLANHGVLILGSGSLTHNLYEFRHQHGDQSAYAAEFAGWVREAVELGDTSRLRRTLSDAPHARRAHPTPEHFWPLLVAAGAAVEPLSARVIDGGIVHGVLSMDAYAFGGSAASA